MKKLFVLTSILFIASVSLSAQRWWKTERASGPVTKKTIELDRFDGVGLSFSGDVYIRQGNTQKVEVEMQESLFQYLNTDIRNGYWNIKFDRNVRTRECMKVYITVPDLNQVAVSGSGNIRGESAFQNLGDFKASISGSGNISMDIEAKDVSAGISGSGDIELSGQAQSVDIRISGSGDVTCHQMVATNGSVSISGSGDVTIHATEKLTVRTSGSGDVAYKGKPSLSARSSGSGDVEAM